MAQNTSATGEFRPRNFVCAGRFNDERPSWSPDGKQIVFDRDSTDVHTLDMVMESDRPRPFCAKARLQPVKRVAVWSL
jgi:hypothetical protein